MWIFSSDEQLWNSILWATSFLHSLEECLLLSSSKCDNASDVVIPTTTSSIDLQYAMAQWCWPSCRIEGFVERKCNTFSSRAKRKVGDTDRFQSRQASHTSWNHCSMLIYFELWLFSEKLNFRNVSTYDVFAWFHSKSHATRVRWYLYNRPKQHVYVTRVVHALGLDKLHTDESSSHKTYRR